MADNIQNYINQIANKIKKLRIDAGFTSYENFANAHDIDRKQYWRIESGSNITISSLIRIIKLHNITIAEFFSDIY